MLDELAPANWRQMHALVRAQAPLLSAPPSASPARPAGLCAVCRGPCGRGSSRCYPCELYWQCAPDGLADVVAPVAFAIKGGPHARRLWQYKSARPAAADIAGPAVLLRALLLVFLSEHGPCVWRAAGIAGPTHLAVVPTARGRPGPHPLRTLVENYLAAPWADLAARPGGQQVRELDPVRFTAAPLPGARVLLIDDTWVTGASAQSAAIALRRAGARSVATIVLGRHVGQAAADRAGLGPGDMPFRLESCAVHADHVVGR